MQQQQKWHALLEPMLTDTPYELVGVTVAGGKKGSVVRIYIDKPGGITIDDISRLSREISVLFDVHEPLTGNYTLEVSSPGLDRPLFAPQHFQAQCGKNIQLKTARMRENRQNFKGTLQDATESQVSLVLEEGETVVFTYEEIEKAKVVF